MAESGPQRTSYQAYLALEEESELKHELVDGTVVAMTRGSLAHARLVARVLTVLTNALRGRPCEVFGSEARLRVPLMGNARYPDGSVVCGPVQTDEIDPDAIINPSLLVEVLSPATEAADRGQKFAEYRSLESLRHYLLLSQDRPRVELFTRVDGGRWVLSVHEAGEVVGLSGLEVEVGVDALYDGVFPLS